MSFSFSSIASENTKVLILIILEVLYERTKLYGAQVVYIVLILIILEVLYEPDYFLAWQRGYTVLILIILEVLYESYHYNHVIFNRKQQKA